MQWTSGPTSVLYIAKREQKREHTTLPTEVASTAAATCWRQPRKHDFSTLLSALDKPTDGNVVSRATDHVSHLPSPGRVEFSMLESTIPHKEASGNKLRVIDTPVMDHLAGKASHQSLSTLDGPWPHIGQKVCFD